MSIECVRDDVKYTITHAVDNVVIDAVSASGSYQATLDPDDYAGIGYVSVDQLYTIIVDGFEGRCCDRNTLTIIKSDSLNNIQLRFDIDTYISDETLIAVLHRIVDVQDDIFAHQMENVKRRLDKLERSSNTHYIIILLLCFVTGVLMSSTL